MATTTNLNHESHPTVLVALKAMLCDLCNLCNFMWLFVWLWFFRRVEPIPTYHRLGSFSGVVVVVVRSIAMPNGVAQGDRFAAEGKFWHSSSGQLWTTCVHCMSLSRNSRWQTLSTLSFFIIAGVWACILTKMTKVFGKFSRGILASKLVSWSKGKREIGYPGTPRTRPARGFPLALSHLKDLYMHNFSIPKSCRFIVSTTKGMKWWNEGYDLIWLTGLIFSHPCIFTQLHIHEPLEPENGNCLPVATVSLVQKRP